MAERKLTVKAVLDDKKLRSGLKFMQTNMVSFAKNTAKLVGAATVGIAVGATLIGVKYETALKRVSSNANATEKEIKKLNETARRLGAETSFSATEAADALYNLSSAGLSVTQSTETLPSVLNLAGAEMVSLSDAASVTTNIMGQFKISADEAERIVNTLSATVSASNQTLPDLAEAMKEAGSQAGISGIEFEETAGALATLAELGFRGGRAGTALNQAFIKITGESAIMRPFLDGVNLSADGLAETLRKLEANGLTAAKAQRLLGAEGGGLVKLLSQGADKIDSYTEAVTGTDTATRKYNEMMQVVENQFKGLLSAAEEVALQLFETFKPELLDAIQLATTHIRAMADWIGKNKEAIKEWVRDGWAKMKEAFQWMIDNSAAISAPLFALGRAAGWAGKIIKGAGDGFGMLAFALIEGNEEYRKAEAHINQYGQAAVDNTTKLTAFADSVKAVTDASGGGEDGKVSAPAPEEDPVSQGIINRTGLRQEEYGQIQEFNLKNLVNEQMYADAVALIREDARQTWLAQDHRFLNASTDAFLTAGNAIINGEKSGGKVMELVKKQTMSAILGTVVKNLKKMVFEHFAARAGELAVDEAIEISKTSAALAGSSARGAVMIKETATNLASRGTRSTDMAAGVAAFYARLGPAGIAPAAANISAYKGMITGAAAFKDGGQSGVFTGRGSGRTDSNLALIGNGEFIVNASSTRNNRDLLESINDDKGGGGGMGQVAAQMAESVASAFASVLPGVINSYFSTRDGEQLIDDALERKELLGATV